MIEKAFLKVAILDLIIIMFRVKLYNAEPDKQQP